MHRALFCVWLVACGAPLAEDEDPMVVDAPSSALPAPAAAATAIVYAARSYWDEASADAFRRTAAGAGWGSAPTAGSSTRIAPGIDYAATPAALVDVAAAASSLEIALDVTLVRRWTSTS